MFTFGGVIHKGLRRFKSVLSRDAMLNTWRCISREHYKSGTNKALSC